MRSRVELFEQIRRDNDREEALDPRAGPPSRRHRRTVRQALACPAAASEEAPHERR